MKNAMNQDTKDKLISTIVYMVNEITSPDKLAKT